MGFLFIVAAAIIVFILIKKNKNDGAKEKTSAVSVSSAGSNESLQEMFAKILDLNNIDYTNDGDTFYISFSSKGLRPDGGNLRLVAELGNNLVILSMLVFANVSPEYESNVIRGCNKLNNEYGEIMTFSLNDKRGIVAKRGIQWNESADKNAELINAVWYIGYIMYLFGEDESVSKNIFNTLT